jgi:hypothetical protein
VIWLAAARRICLEVVRMRDAYATTDGNGTLALAATDYAPEERRVKLCACPL